MRFRGTIVLALCAALVGCDAPDFNYQHGRITMTANQLLLHAAGAQDASINASGDFRVGGKAVAVTPAQRGLLMLYYRDVEDIRQRSTGMGEAVAAATIKHAVDAKSGPGRDRPAGSQSTSPVDQLSQAMCQDAAGLKQIQDKLVAQMPAFKPYGDIFQKTGADDCMRG